MLFYHYHQPTQAEEGEDKAQGSRLLLLLHQASQGHQASQLQAEGSKGLLRTSLP